MNLTKHIFHLAVSTVVLQIVLVACTKESDVAVMTMNMQMTGTAKIWMFGSGTVTIDWGDGTASETHTLWAYENSNFQNHKSCYYHDYSGPSIHVIKVTGKNITYLDCSWSGVTSLDVRKNTKLEILDCSWSGVTSLDVSKNTKLTYLYCSTHTLTDLDVSKNTALMYLDCKYSQLMRLDVSRNTALYWLNCQYNQLSTSALNDLFRTLHDKSISSGKRIAIYGNPGTDACDVNITNDKGWIVWKEKL